MNDDASEEGPGGLLGGPPPLDEASGQHGPVQRIAHLSDVHFGAISHPSVVGALVTEINLAEVDLVVISGDLTQRARSEEFAAAREMIEAFEAPVLVVPGNHDVPAWWHHPIERIMHPTRRYRKAITETLTPRFSTRGLSVFGLSSAYGLTIKGGKIRGEHLVAMRAFFRQQPPEAVRVLVLHHHLRRLTALGSHDVARGARDALRNAGECGVDLILCGHLHTSVVEHAEVVPPSEADPHGHRVVIASAGTATSSRGRRDDREVNFYNQVAITPDRIAVEERRFDPDGNRFETERESIFAVSSR